MYADNNAKGSLCNAKAILVVEDDADIGTVFVEALQTETPYYFLWTKDATQALNAVKAVIPDLFLLDCTLPGINGLELCERFQSIEELKHIPVLLMSASAPEQEIKKRPLTFIQKPFELDTLLQKIDELLAN